MPGFLLDLELLFHTFCTCVAAVVVPLCRWAEMSLTGTLVYSTVVPDSRLVENFVQPASCLVDTDVG